MKAFGSFLIVIGIAMLIGGSVMGIHAYQMDVTISLDPTPTDDWERLDYLQQRLRELKRLEKGEDPNPRSVNKYLMDKRMTQLISGCSMAIVGGLLLCSGLVANRGGFQCPTCGGRVHRGYSICQHCSNDLVWGIMHSPVTPARAESLQQEQYQREIKTAERFPEYDKQSVEELSSSEPVWTYLFNGIKNLPLQIDSILRKAAGEGNDIVLWFFRFVLVAFIVVGILAGIYVLFWAMR